MSPVRVATADGVAVVTLDDPDRRNALTLGLVDELVAAFDRVEANEDIGAVVVTGAPPAFCAGADLGELGRAGEAHLRHIYEGFLRVARSPLPTVAAVNGAAVGAGVNLALACDLRLAGHSARVDVRFLRLGIHPGGGHTWMLRRAAGPQAAAALVLFGETLDGDAAARVGFAWRSVADDALLDEARAVAGRAAAVARPLAARAKQSLREVADIATHGEAVEYELRHQLWSMGQPAFRPARPTASGPGTGPGAPATPRP